jgi:hypothetical protein
MSLENALHLGDVEQRYDEEEQRLLAAALADPNLVWAAADFFIEPDIQEFGIRHKIPELSKEFWRGAFIAGWRAALKAKAQTNC